jgi:D-beta-D-heptose 7-phosphate kinase / D-beta-D-heptose 1-phosphate adenosyltransferase
MTLTDLPVRWRDTTVLVVGDALLDGWLVGAPRRLCREAPAPVLDVERTTYAGGGAANTAINIAALGARSILAAAVGEDPDGGRLRRRLEAAGVDHRLVPVRGRRTLAKRRLIGDEQIMLRFDEGDTGPLPPSAASSLMETVAAALDAGVDAMIVDDYGGGGGEAVRALLAQRRDAIPLLVVDAHDPRPWAVLRPDLVTPSFAEACRLLDCDAASLGLSGACRVDWVTEAADRLLTLAGAPAVAVTLDADGSVVLTAEVEPVRTYAQPAPASHTTGAGDAYAAAFTLALAARVPLADAAEVAQYAATAATRTPGTAVCDTHGLLAACGETDQATLSTADLVAEVSAHRARGRRIVFTNGCFDVLHRGHVGYLAQAKRLGDVLIVAVNSDDSVRRLKGPERPVNPVEDRVAVLAALACVDHVVVFEEDSPANLIALVRPDVYVKGGDYRPEMIPEAPLVRRLGGEVVTLDYLPDRSTSKLINRIRASGNRPAAAVAKSVKLPMDAGKPAQPSKSGHPSDLARGRRTRS